MDEVKKFRTASEIDEDIRNRKKEEFKKTIGNDIIEVFEQVFPKKVKKKLSIIKWMGMLFGILFLLTLILGCIWALKFFLQNLF